MNETALNRFWELLGWVLALKSEVFEQINAWPDGSTVAVVIVLAASLSQVIAHSVILFVNRITPVRFIFTLLIGTVLFAFGYIFLVLSTWLISFAPFTVEAPFGVVARTLGFSYAPLIFSVFGAIPYLGEPILSILSLWQLLVMVVGFAAASNTGIWQAFGTVALGWVTLWAMQRTIGQPIASFGRWVVSQVAGVELVTKRQQLSAMVSNRLGSSSAPDLTEAKGADTGEVAISPQRGEVEQAIAPSSRRSSIPASTNRNAERDRQTKTSAKNRFFKLSKIARKLRGIIILASVTFTVLVLLSPIQHWWFAWYENLDGIFKLVFNLVWIGIIALMAAALLAPLEALGWWAGW